MKNLDDSVIEDASKYDHVYFFGIENRLIRYYYYLNQGLNILNQFRNLFLGIIALYIALHLDNWLLLVGMFIPCVIILTAIGYYNTHTVAKAIDWLSMRFSSHYGIRQFNYQQGIYDALQDIRKSIEKK